MEQNQEEINQPVLNNSEVVSESSEKSRMKLRKSLLYSIFPGLFIGILLAVIFMIYMIASRSCDGMGCAIVPILGGYIIGASIIFSFIVGIIKYNKKAKQYPQEKLPNAKRDNILIIIFGILAVGLGYTAVFNIGIFLSDPIGLSFISVPMIFFGYMFWPLGMLILLTIIFIKNIKKALIILIPLFIFSSLLHSLAWSINSNKVGDSINCHDSDGGKNYSIKGTATGPIGNITHTLTDMCPQTSATTGGYINEYYCNNGQLRTDFHYCPDGCKDGVCVATSITQGVGTTTNINESISTSSCIDSDGGINYDIAGKITWNSLGDSKVDSADYCSNNLTAPALDVRTAGQYLLETYCTQGSHPGAFQVYKCPNGCSNGVCVATSSISN